VIIYDPLRSDRARGGEGGAAMTWSSKRGVSPWRDYLTADEKAIIEDAEHKRSDARQRLAEATAIIAPIQNRAIHRAKYAIGKETP